MTREEAIQILSTRDAHGVLCGYTSGVTEALDMAIKALSEEQKTGKWIEIENGKYLCSNCSRITIGYPPSNCPHCRAKMQGGGTE